MIKKVVEHIQIILNDHAHFLRVKKDIAIKVECKSITRIILYDNKCII